MLTALAPKEDNVAALNGDHVTITKPNGPMDASAELREGHVIPRHVVCRANVKNPTRAPTTALLRELDE